MFESSPRRRRSPLLFFVVAGVALCLAGLLLVVAVSCVVNRDEDGEYLGPPTLPILKGEVRVARYPSIDPVVLTLDRGLLDRRGYTVVEVPVPGPTEAVAALLRGDADIAWLPTGQAALVYEQGRPVVAIAPCHAASGTLLALPGGAVSVADLAGGSIAGRVTGVSFALATAGLARAGLGPDRWTAVPVMEAADVMTAVRAGDAKAGVAPAPVDVAAIASGQFAVVETLASLWERSGETKQPLVGCTWLATREAADRLGALRNDLADANGDIAELVADRDGYEAWLLGGGLTEGQAEVAVQLARPDPPVRFTRAPRDAVLEQLRWLRAAGYLRTDVWSEPGRASGFFGD